MSDHIRIAIGCAIVCLGARIMPPVTGAVFIALVRREIARTAADRDELVHLVADVMEGENG